jgi:hypothetical protein
MARWRPYLLGILGLLAITFPFRWPGLLVVRVRAAHRKPPLGTYFAETRGAIMNSWRPYLLGILGLLAITFPIRWPGLLVVRVRAAHRKPPLGTHLLKRGGDHE